MTSLKMRKNSLFVFKCLGENRKRVENKNGERERERTQVDVVLADDGNAMCRFHQHFTRMFFVRKIIAQLFLVTF